MLDIKQWVTLLHWKLISIYLTELEHWAQFTEHFSFLYLRTDFMIILFHRGYPALSNKKLCQIFSLFAWILKRDYLLRRNAYSDMNTLYIGFSLLFLNRVKLPYIRYICINNIYSVYISPYDCIRNLWSLISITCQTWSRRMSTSKRRH